ncbi:alpha-ketoglutarate-dependent dioxygenase AlkB family protein [Nannocystis pusilla]|uniref:Alpha-ketoglutarate-dependent dioxygenase AlkB n=1 Tax=Nannocystis pusilla TaxID=889268 RepID=A0ABS7TZX1_9BACT|nr:alpha-ketoglutarate-dependent dioxygenase AlkB [Nannocystis pusilla]MBZ5713749.1 alpha-ketoglutarate-dependent dioxygenase AlkB [Nannocystis pusilla]
MSQVRIIDDSDGAIVEYASEFLAAGDRSALLAELTQARDRFDRDRVLMYGKTIDAPRMVCAFGDDGLHYRYAGVDRTTHPWPPHLRGARDRIAAVCGHPFNYALVNLYQTGDDYIGWHADKVSDLVPGSSIASLSLGAARPFQLRHKSSGAAHEVMLASGSLLVMRGTCQQFYKHSLPRRRGVTEPRFNITFRHVRSDG